MKDNIIVNATGHLLIKDLVTNEIMLDQTNAIHPQNVAGVIARALSRDSNGFIFKLSFGNGGTFFNSSNAIVYRPPNTVGTNATLYNQTYTVQVDDQSVGTPVTNSVVSSAGISPSITSLVTITAQLNANEPAGQAIADNLTTNPEALFVFDEVGLQTSDNLLLTHLVFNPVEKTGNRAFLFIYVLTISVS